MGKNTKLIRIRELVSYRKGHGGRRWHWLKELMKIYLHRERVCAFIEMETLDSTPAIQGFSGADKT